MSDQPSQFSSEEFLSSVFKGSSITSQPPVPAGEYVGTIRPGSIVYRTVGEDNLPVLEMMITVEDEKAKAATGRADPAARYTCWLEKGPNGVDWKNSANLGRLRAALGQNKDGEDWSPSMLEGKPIRIWVETQMRGDEVYTKVKRIAKP